MWTGFELTFQSGIAKNYMITSNNEPDWNPIKSTLKIKILLLLVN